MRCLTTSIHVHETRQHTVNRRHISKGKGKSTVAKHYAMKTCGGMEPLILTPGNRWQWSASIDNKEPLVRNGRKAVWVVDCVWNEKAHARKPDFVFRKNGRVHLNRWWRQFSRLLAGEVYASAVVMLDTPCSKVVWRVLATHSIRQFPLHFPTRASPCAITFQLDSTAGMDAIKRNCL